MLNVWGRGWRRVIRLGPVQSFCGGLQFERVGGRGTWAHGTHETLRRLRVSFDSESREAGSRKAELERMLGTGNYQHDSRVMTLIVGAAHDTRDGKVNTKCCSCCALLWVVYNDEDDEFQRRKQAL